jgi:hypothetical protein
MENHACHILICIGPVSNLDLDRLTKQPRLAFYRVAGADLRLQIDMALLDHMHCPCTIVFVGGDEAKREAAAYHVKHIEDTAAVNDALITFWLDTKPESGSQ